MQPAFEKSDADETAFFTRDVSSLAPIALDRTPAPTAVDSNSTESLARLERTVNVRREPGSDKQLFIAAAVALAVLSLVSAVSLRVPPPPSHARVEARAPRVVAAQQALFIPALTAPAKDLILLDEDEGATIAVSALPGHHTSATTHRAPQRGLLRVPQSVKGVLVDGAPHRVEGGILPVPCGTHTIKAPSQPARSVVIACAGTTTL